MPILRAEMARGIAVYVLGIDIGFSKDQSLDDAKLSSDAGDV